MFRDGDTWLNGFLTMFVAAVIIFVACAAIYGLWQIPAPWNAVAIVGLPVFLTVIYGVGHLVEKFDAPWRI